MNDISGERTHPLLNDLRVVLGSGGGRTASAAGSRELFDFFLLLPPRNGMRLRLLFAELIDSGLPVDEVEAKDGPGSVGEGSWRD